ncbi:MAG: anaerobic ribonucleoside-triphosphate reductase activating protein [Candidatus Coatesbacteria bacterium]|nr:anaerobic ribonucleoside-triphosphate reductase activating protein [Candidatus Coatesbacteria bacterium]
MPLISGIVWTSLVDLPASISTVLFLKGCNWNCGFCHNSYLLESTDIPGFKLAEIKDRISERKSFIDGIVISGGEPTINDDIIEFIYELKEMGIKIKLDTNGSKPDILSRIVESRLVEWISMDIKTSFSKYELATKTEINKFDILKSIEVIGSMKEKAEFRTTCVPFLVEKTDIADIVQYLPSKVKYSLQQFYPRNSKEDYFKQLTPYTSKELNDMAEVAKSKHKCVILKE